MGHVELAERIRRVTLPLEISDDCHLPKIAAQRPASVVIPFVMRQGEWRVVLTKRPDYLPTHAGQISFPGGRTEEGETPMQGALREVFEEIGVKGDSVTLLGRLPSFNAVTEYRVTPFVGILAQNAQIIPCENEVAAVYELPLSFFMNPDNHKARVLNWDGQDHIVYDMPWPNAENPDVFVWGMTAMMLYRLYERGLRCA